MAVNGSQQRCIQSRLAHRGAEECLRLTEGRERPLRRSCGHRQCQVESQQCQDFIHHLTEDAAASDLGLLQRLAVGTQSAR